VQFDLSLDLPDPLYNELIEAALECRVSPKIFASQAVEACLAGRRLESSVTPAPHGARIRMPEVGEL
jgi:hypothetical protein